jgi:hypothetical protein
MGLCHWEKLHRKLLAFPPAFTRHERRLDGAYFPQPAVWGERGQPLISTENLKLSRSARKAGIIVLEHCRGGRERGDVEIGACRRDWIRVYLAKAQPDQQRNGRRS